MKFLVRWAFRFLILFIILMVALLLLKDLMLKSFAEHQLRAQTGMDVHIGKLELDLLSPALTVEDLKIYNRAEFGGTPFLEIPDLHIEYDMSALAERRLHLTLVRVWLTEMNIVESQDGRTNLILGFPTEKPSARPAKPVNWMGFDFAGIDVVNLSLGKVNYRSVRRPGKVTELKLDLKNQVLTRVTSWNDFTERLMRILLRRGITITAEVSYPVRPLSAIRASDICAAVPSSPLGIVHARS